MTLSTSQKSIIAAAIVTAALVIGMIVIAVTTIPNNYKEAKALCDNAGYRMIQAPTYRCVDSRGAIYDPYSIPEKQNETR